jgi:hypothetical protein
MSLAIATPVLNAPDRRIRARDKLKPPRCICLRAGYKEHYDLLYFELSRFRESEGGRKYPVYGS